MNSPRYSIYVTVAAAAIVISQFCSNTRSMSCDTWVSMQDVTADGSVILAKNSDRPWRHSHLCTAPTRSMARKTK